MQFWSVVINVLIARRSAYLMRKTEYGEITIYNFAIHLVYVERYSLNVLIWYCIFYRRKVTSFLVEEIARMSAVKFYDDD